MKMRIFPTLALAAALLSVPTLAGAVDPEKGSPIGDGHNVGEYPDKFSKPGGKCIFMRSIYDWRAIDRHHLVVWYNSRHHAVLLELENQCHSLKFEETIAFSSNMDGRLCPYGGDAVLVGYQRCTIGSISEYDPYYFKKKKDGGDGDDGGEGEGEEKETSASGD